LSIHTVRAEELIVVSDGFVHVETAVHETVDAFSWLQVRSICPQGEMVILIVLAHARQVLNDWHSELLQHLSITDAGSLQDARCGICTSRDDNELACMSCAQGCVLRRQELRVRQELGIRLELDTSSSFAIEKNADNLLLYQNMQVGIVITLQLRMKVAVSCVLTSSRRADVLVVPLNLIVLVKILQIVGLGMAKSCGGINECVLCSRAYVRALGDIDWAVISVFVLITFAMIRFELI
jgi:hypothetical protein